MEAKQLNQFNWKRFKEVQANLPNVSKGGRGNFGKYMTLDELNPKMLTVLGQHGFAWVTMPVLQDGTQCLKYELVDTESGASISGVMALAAEKQNPQGQGSAITYARRYSLASVTGLVADMDDDGQESTDQAKKVNTLATKKDELNKLLESEGYNTAPKKQAQIHDVLKKLTINSADEAQKVIDAVKKQAIVEGAKSGNDA
jgi:hypothetical protein